MGVDASITSSSCQILVLSVGNMQMRFWVAIFFGQPKINDIDLVTPFADAHEKVVWFYVSVNKVLGVNVFDT